MITALVSSNSTYAVGQREVTYVDPSRSTDANGPGFPGAKTRTLHTYIYYPASDLKYQFETATLDAKPDAAHGKFPLVIFSHGNRTIAPIYAGNTIALASAGYVVVAPEYPLSRITTPGGPKPADVKNQPADATFVLNTACGVRVYLPKLMFADGSIWRDDGTKSCSLSIYGWAKPQPSDE